VPGAGLPCGAYATTPVKGCSAHYGSGQAYTPTSASARLAQGASPHTTGASPAQSSPSATNGTAGTTTTTSATRPPAATTTGATTTTTAPPPANGVVQTLQNLLGFLTK